MHDMRINPSMLSAVISELRDMYKELIYNTIRLFIRAEYENSKESAITPFSLSITPYPESSSFAVLFVNDEVYDN